MIVGAFHVTLAVAKHFRDNAISLRFIFEQAQFARTDVASFFSVFSSGDVLDHFVDNNSGLYFNSILLECKIMNNIMKTFLRKQKKSKKNYMRALRNYLTRKRLR